MADLIGKIKGKIDIGISKVNVKSKELIGKQKIKLQISELEAQKKTLLLDLGKLTHLMIGDSDQFENKLPKKEASTKKTKNMKPDKWEQAVLSVLNSICDEKLDKILFENTDKEFKITAKALLAEVQKSLPKSEQKEQNLQWLGRVISKFGITSRKYSKRINHERETVYEFEKLKTLSTLQNITSQSSPSKEKNAGSNFQELMVSKSHEINALDLKIKNLEKKLSKEG